MSSYTTNLAPVLALQDTWFRASGWKDKITKIIFSNTPPKGQGKGWNASAYSGNGSVRAYRRGTEITIVGNGTDRIIANKDSRSMFEGFSALKTIENLELLDTSNVTDMSRTFKGCSSLATIDLSSWDTSNVEDMGSMFWGCKNLSHVDLTSFDTSKVIDMGYMFCDCASLITLDLSSFNTTNVADMEDMFRGCSELTTLNLSSFDTSNVTDMGGMFEYCVGLTAIDLSSFDTSKVTQMSNVFQGCNTLTVLDLSSWDMPNLREIRMMFYKCTNLKTIYVSDSWPVGGAYDKYHMFTGCTSLMGECGTTWAPGDEGNDWQGACIDSWDHPGFFTRKPTA